MHFTIFYNILIKILKNLYFFLINFLRIRIDSEEILTILKKKCSRFNSVSEFSSYFHEKKMKITLINARNKTKLP